MDAKAGEEVRAIVGRLVNAGWDKWRSDGAHPVHVAVAG